MASSVDCLCGQTFTIPAERPWTWGCHVCGRKLTVLSDGKVRELAGPKGENEERLIANVAATPVLPAAHAARTCPTCGAPVRQTCAWCGQYHCWLHAPAGHPDPALDNRQIDWQLPPLLYLIAILAMILCMAVVFWLL